MAMKMIRTFHLAAAKWNEYNVERRKHIPRTVVVGDRWCHLCVKRKNGVENTRGWASCVDWKTRRGEWRGVKEAMPEIEVAIV